MHNDDVFRYRYRYDKNNIRYRNTTSQVNIQHFIDIEN